MSALKTEKYFLVKLLFKKKEDGSTKEVWVSERSLPEDYLYSGSPEVLGILISIDGFGQEMGEVISKNSSGSISLKATRGTVAFHKRIYDLLDDHILVNQEIKSYSFQKKRNQDGDILDLLIEGVGLVATHGLDIAGQTFNIEVNPHDISTNIVNNRYEIEAEDYPGDELLNKANNSYGAIAFGENLEIIPVPLVQKFEDNDNARPTASDLLYGLGSTLGAFSLKVSGSDYIESGAFSDNTNAFKRLHFDDDNSLETPTGTEQTLDPYNAAGNRAWFFPMQNPTNDTGGKSEMVTSVILWPRSSAARSEAEILAAKGEITLEIGKVTKTDNGTIKFLPIQNAKASVEKVNYSFYGGVSLSFYMIFRFEQPFAVNFQEDNIYGKIVSTGLGSESDFYFKGKGGTGEKEVYYQNVSGNENAILSAGFSIVNLMDSGPPQYSTIRMTPIPISGGTMLLNSELRVFASGSALNRYNIERESLLIRGLVVDHHGLLDDGSGTITGVSQSIIKNSFDIIKTLYYSQNGNSLDGWDETRFPNTRDNSVDLGGVEYSSITFRDLVTELLDACSSALIKQRNGELCLWTYGNLQEVVGTISERDCQLESMSSLGVEDIINKISLAYDRKEVPLSEGLVDSKYYDKLKIKEDAESQSIYGVLEPIDVFTVSQWINNEEAAEKYLTYKIEQKAYERSELVVRVPYWKDNYREFELWDIINFSHIDLPTEEGTLPPNQTKDLFSDGDDDDWSLGEVLRHAKTRTFRIVKRDVLYNIGEEPEIRFKFRTLGKNEKK